MLAGITIFTFFALALGLGLLVKFRSQRAAFWCGGLLLVYGLCMSLLMSLINIPGHRQAQMAFLVNSYLVVAAVGANIFASGVCLGLKPSEPLSFGWPKRNED